MQIAIVFLMFLALSARQVEAYIDPGIGSYTLQLIVGGLLGGLFIIKRYWYSIIEFLTRKKRGDKIYIIPDRASSSPRRWEQEGIVFCILRNWVLISLYFCGVSPKTLARYYRFGRGDHKTSSEEQT